MKNKLFLFVLLGLFLISFTSAMDCDGTFLGTFKVNTNIELRQTCDSCSYVTLSSLTYPNSTMINVNTNMTKTGVDYNYSFRTDLIGNYYYSVFGDKDGTLVSENFCFEVTPSGNSGSEWSIFFIILFVIIYGIGFFGFFGKNPLISFIGGIIMILLGIYIINNGIIIYRNQLTVAISYITLGIGFIFMLVPAVETIEQNL
jgi:hypothetical protein